MIFIATEIFPSAKDCFKDEYVEKQPLDNGAQEKSALWKTSTV